MGLVNVKVLETPSAALDGASLSPAAIFRKVKLRSALSCRSVSATQQSILYWQLRRRYLVSKG